MSHFPFCSLRGLEPCGSGSRSRPFLAGAGTAAKQAAKAASPLGCKLNLKNGVPLCVGEATKVRLRSVNRETCREVWLPAWRVDDLVVQIRRRRDLRWSYIVGQFGSQVKVYSGI